MIWPYLTLLAYFINAVVFVIDKYLLVGRIPKYHAYTFGVSVLSLVTVVLIPFGVYWPGIYNFFLMMAVGTIFFGGLLFTYKSVKEKDVSVAVTQVGTLSAIFTYIFSVPILRDALSFTGTIAFIFLVFGLFLLGKTERRIFASTVPAGIMFGIYYVLMKYSFNATDFVNGLFWTRIGFVGSAFSSLFFEHVREEVRFTYYHSPVRPKLLLIFNKILAGIGFTILYFAISLGNVTLINGLLGLQFVMIMAITLLLGDKITGLKTADHPNMFYKLAGTILILIGLMVLFISIG